MQVLALLAQPLGPVLVRIVALQQVAVSGILHQLAGAAILGGPQEGELHGLALGGEHRHRLAARRVFFPDALNGPCQGRPLGFRQLVCLKARLAQRSEGRLPAHNGSNAAAAADEGVGHRQILPASRRHQADGAALEEVRLVGFRRQRIGQAGQQLAHLTVLKVHTLQRIDDLLALEQHQVGVAAHQFGGQRVFHQIAHLVHALEVEEHNAVALLRPHIQQAAARQMLAQQHTEAGRNGGVFKALARKANPRGPAAGRQ